MHELSGTVALITGAAGALGGAAARGFHAAGASLALLDRGSGRLARQFPEWVGRGDVAFLDAVDLAVPESVQRAVAVARERFGRIDAVVSAAGAYRASGPLAQSDLAEWDFLMAANARSTLNVCRAVLPGMLAQRAGKIVNVGAMAALRGSVPNAAYSASKSAVVRLTEAIADEVRGTGLNVNCVLPSTIDTAANREAMPRADREGWLSLESIVAVVLFLCSDAAAAVHGAAIPLQGSQ